MGFSVGKVFRPIEDEMQRYVDVESIYMPAYGYNIKSILQNIRYTKNAIRYKKYDIVHITGTEHYLLPFLSSKNTIVTVHDLKSVLKSGLMGLLKKVLFVYTLKCSRIVTFISDKSNREADDYVAIDKEKRVTIHDPISSDFVYTEIPKDKQTKTILHRNKNQ